MKYPCCVVCLGPKDGPLIFCSKCARSYDRAAKHDGTIASLLVWCAQRTRRFARLK